MRHNNGAWIWDDSVKYDGTICSVMEFGFFVEFVSDGEKLEGQVHRSKLPKQEQDKDLRTRYQIGQKVVVRILDIDRNDHIRLHPVKLPS